MLKNFLSYQTLTSQQLHIQHRTDMRFLRGQYVIESQPRRGENPRGLSCCIRLEPVGSRMVLFCSGAVLAFIAMSNGPIIRRC
ncbi:hypothetical protein BDV29DRAFT_165460 [Aspergillus leporis]|jgi:hypothetical protein|uniref:Uncharacterized protein n=1 Tax=Aspergillus leporis TaxID=41062 RepID=A0A5N5XDQ3_9EURO|nr:hypothetical protein BDV29DRAFT_165460 [Aspergillus leporis]